MKSNIIEAVRQRLQYPPLHKVDPNTQDIAGKEEESGIALLAQAAIPAVLAAIYKLSGTSEGAGLVWKTDPSDDVLALLFNNREKEVIARIAGYSGVSVNQAGSHLETIADAALAELRIQAGHENGPEKLADILQHQRHELLVRLPAAIRLGEILNDTSLDDKTNKMEGPVSGVIHKMEDRFSGKD